MSSVPSLVWSSRENIRAQVLSLLQAAPSADPWLRFRIVGLLGIFGGPEQLPLLRTLLFDTREDFSVRNRALWVGARHGLRLSGTELSQLLHRTSARTCPGHYHLGPCGPSLGTLLDPARLDDDGTEVEAALLQVSSEERARILADSDTAPLPARLVEGLFTRWHQSDRHEVSEAGNLDVALAHRERPEAWKLLTEWTRELTAYDQQGLLYGGLSREELARLVRDAPDAMQRAANALLLPLSDLRGYFGEEALLRLLLRIVRAESSAWTVPYGLVERQPAFARATVLLCEWPEARPFLYRYLCDFTLATEVRHELLDSLFDHDRAVAIRWALVAARYADNTPLVRFVLRLAAQRPEPGDRPLFLTGLRGTDDVSQCFALEGLLALGESGASWCDRLGSLIHANHPAVRLRAAAGLAQQGRSEWLPMLRHAALEAPEPWLRADALRWLGQVDAEASRPVLLRALTTEGPWGNRQIAPGADEAVWALSRLGSVEDLCALLDASLKGCCSALLDEALEFHLARQEGHPVKNVPPPLRSYVADVLDGSLRVGAGT
ncbi:HEAT repeat domain-containing protein [Pyxidicoccus xibeiensis]|uniref:HEAT repeat domain-containing protein n=1 Tax=Pyxidicoccus xibeiensis TaxID=2906759 RepID=UPI0020A6FC3A|nr:HEAT repeat domain-containing protein [Pyxidicoccus xibeiensis]MCP3143177.1 HEAT repeat domain-containing protein [Pyxidicoccus xibeiensis]